MKRLIIISIIFNSPLFAFSQKDGEAAINDLSAKIFKWEVAGLTDSLNSVFHDKLQVWGTSGDPVNKTEYLQRLGSPAFIHNNVTIEKSTALIADNTAVVNGDGTFELTISGNQTMLHLSYTEVLVLRGQFFFKYLLPAAGVKYFTGIIASAPVSKEKTTP